MRSRYLVMRYWRRSRSWRAWCARGGVGGGGQVGRGALGGGVAVAAGGWGAQVLGPGQIGG
ncbi:MAG TPA: hypothetical protein VF874_10050 [Mycobacterium sp.]